MVSFSNLHYRCARRFAASWMVVLIIPVTASASTPPPWQNQMDWLDVSGDSVRAVDDFHLVFSELTHPQIAEMGMLPVVATPPPFLDINGDTYFAPLDALYLVAFSASFEAGIPKSDTTMPGPVSVQFDFRDPNGTTITEVSVGDPFVLVATVNDDREKPFGLTTAYFDLAYDVDLAAAGKTKLNEDLVIQFSLEGTPAVTGLDEIGGFATGMGAHFELFEIEFEAADVGSFTVGGANGYALLLGEFEAIAPSFRSASLTIVPEPAGALTLLCCLAAGCLARRR